MKNSQIKLEKSSKDDSFSSKKKDSNISMDDEISNFDFSVEDDNVINFIETNKNSSYNCKYKNNSTSNENNFHHNKFILKSKKKIEKNYLRKKSERKLNKEDEKITIDNKIFNLMDIRCFKIYLQMELCSETLDQYISKINNINKNNDIYLNKNFSNSNSSSFSLKNTLCYEINSNNNFIQAKNLIKNEKLKISENKIINLKKKLKVFIEITKALNYLHTKENIIHRDIKPQNIFISKDNKIKIGDFGLSTSFVDKKYSSKNLNLTRKNSDSNKDLINFDSIKNINKNNYFNDDSTINQTFFHTKNIGTLLYSPPEQLNNNYYDFKVDIFSLGLVLYEIINPFKTHMEKNLRFSDLKKGKICGNLLNNQEVLENLILEMCNIDPNKRPDTNKILEIVKNEISNKNKKISINIKDNVNDNFNTFTDNCNKIYFNNAKHINEIKEELKKMENFFNFSEDGIKYRNILKDIDSDFSIYMSVKKFEEEKNNISYDIEYSKSKIFPYDYYNRKESKFTNDLNYIEIFDKQIKNKNSYCFKNIFEEIKENIHSLNNISNFIISFLNDNKSIKNISF